MTDELERVLSSICNFLYIYILLVTKIGLPQSTYYTDY
jgi:hypothetical protein